MKHKIKKSKFLNWYFSDREDSQIMGNRIKDNLLKSILLITHNEWEYSRIGIESYTRQLIL